MTYYKLTDGQHTAIAEALPRGSYNRIAEATGRKMQRVRQEFVFKKKRQLYCSDIMDAAADLLRSLNPQSDHPHASAVVGIIDTTEKITR